MTKKLFLTLCVWGIQFNFYCCIAQKRVDIIAHRGASSIAPENTLIAFEKAIEAGADYLEMDVHISKDDSLIVIHDPSVDRTTNGSGLVRDLTYAELKALDAGYNTKFGNMFQGGEIPTLYEVLALAKGKAKVAIELKADIAYKVVPLIEQMGMEGQVIFQSYSTQRLLNVKVLNSLLPIMLITNILTERSIHECKEINGEYIGCGFLITSALIDYAHQNGIKVFGFTVNDHNAMNELISKDIDGIITDFPQSLYILNRVKIDVFPNPVTTTASIQISYLSKPVDVEIYDMRGFHIQTLKNINTGTNALWEPSVTTCGVYFLCFNIEGIWVSRKIIYYSQ